jgi:predicted transport protein
VAAPGSSIAETVASVLSTADSLLAAGAAANEANTKQHLIDPLIGALGWNVHHWDEVDREFKVYDGTFLDYALRIDGKPKLFLEAKSVGKTLTDKAFIAQTVNYANNEGVVWCVLTNGLVYQVYKSNEPVPMERKLLLEVDLREAVDEGARAQVVNSLKVLSRQAVESGELDTWGEVVFTDIRTRSALAKLANDPPPGFVTAISQAVEGPKISPERLRGSLARVLGQLASTHTAGPVAGSPPEADVKPRSAPEKKLAEPEPGKKQYEVASHTAKKPSGIVDLFEQVDAFAMALGPDVQRRPTKMYIGYRAGKKSFFTMELQKTRIWVYLSIPPSEALPWNDDEMRDASNIGHFGMGDTEFDLKTAEQLSRLEPLIKQAYARNRH